MYHEKLRQQRQRMKQADGRDTAGVRDARAALPSQRRRPARRSRRIGFAALCGLMFFLASLLIYRLYIIQVVDYSTYAEAAADQHYIKVVENPRRGSIMDRNGLELAGMTYVYRVGITPRNVSGISRNIPQTEIAAKIAEILDLDPNEVMNQLEKTDATYIQLKKNVTRAEAEALKSWRSEANVGGIRIDAEPFRFYTNGTLASQVIGFTNFSDGNLVGQLGIELQFNRLLTGEPGYTYVETDNYSGRGELPFSVPTSLRARDGQNVVLNIDINIQKIAQEVLQNAVEVNDVTGGGSVIVMNPFTGAILAMASYPYFSSSNPAARPPDMDLAEWNNLGDSKIEHLSSVYWRNKAISNTYEPGSTMKSITVAMVLEEALTREAEVLSGAPITVAGWTISCWRNNFTGRESIEQAIWNSNNPIIAQLSQRLGVQRFYEYISAFGLADRTGIDLPAEGAGIQHASPEEIDMVTLSFGESSTLTPLQLITAYSALANGGRLLRPMAVKAVTDSNGAIIREFQPETIRKVISESTSTRVMELLKGVVLYGTGSPAYVEGYSVAGKTSTSTDDDGYNTLSFAGIAPAERPEIVVLVVLEKPSDKELSSRIASAACGEIISRTLEYMGISRIYTDRDVSRLTALTAVPDLAGKSYGTAVRELAALGLRAEAGDSSMSAESVVRFQWPEKNTKLHRSGVVVLYPTAEPEEQLVVIPDFTGKNVNECLSTAAERGLNIRIVGNSLGVAASQDPVPTFRRNPALNPDEEDPEAGNRPTHLRRGSIVSIFFQTFEEVIAQTGETD